MKKLRKTFNTILILASIGVFIYIVTNLLLQKPVVEEEVGSTTTVYLGDDITLDVIEMVYSLENQVNTVSNTIGRVYGLTSRDELVANKQLYLSRMTETCYNKLLSSTADNFKDIEPFEVIDVAYSTETHRYIVNGRTNRGNTIYYLMILVEVQKGLVSEFDGYVVRVGEDFK